MNTNELTNQTNPRQGRNIYYVSARKAFGKIKTAWEVKKEKATRVQKLFDTKVAAIDYATHLAFKTKAIVLVRKVNGSLDQKIWWQWDQTTNQWLHHCHKYLNSQKNQPDAIIKVSQFD